MRTALTFFLLATTFALAALPVQQGTARIVTHQFMAGNPTLQNHTIETTENLLFNNQPLAYVCHLSPTGFVILSADTSLPPVIAWSGTSDFVTDDRCADPIVFLTNSQRDRITALSFIPESEIAECEQSWEALLSGSRNERIDQWPPAGSTPTEGWVLTRWTQTGPYNMYCPLDLESNSRPYAGCPSIAMGQILYYWETVNGTRLNDNDDYHHNYGGQSYQIDDDADTYGFPDFPTLNGYLDEYIHHVRYNETITNSDRAALIFACGIACTQVYNPGGSGTFGVGQALTAYHRFDFDTARLLTDTEPDLYEIIAQSMRDAIPIHLAVVTPDWTSGHNFVVDGYNSDNFFHINFGWAGQNDGWYLLPEEIPYNLTVIEGAIADTIPPTFAHAWPEQVDFLTMEDIQTQTVTVTNYHHSPILIDGLLPDENLENLPIAIEPAQSTFPVELQPLGTFDILLTPDLPIASALRDTLSGTLRIITEHTGLDIAVRFNTALITGTHDESVTPLRPLLTNRPNPFNPSTTIDFILPRDGETTLAVYNLRGQKISTLVSGFTPAGAHTAIWNGRDDSGREVGSGVYFLRLTTPDSVVTKRALLLK